MAETRHRVGAATWMGRIGSALVERGLRRWHARVARRRTGAAVPGMPASYARGGEAARNSTFTRAAPVRTISSRRAAS